VEAVDPTNIVAGQKYKTGAILIYPPTANIIDDVQALFSGWIIFNEASSRWQELGQEAIKGNWDASGGTLPSSSSRGDKYVISVSGVVNGVQLNENDTITANINDASSSQTGGIFDDWVVVGAITITSSNVSRPNGNTVEQGLTDLEANKVDAESGKGLSTEDYTSTEKDKLGNIDANAQVNVQANFNESDNTQDSFIQNKPVLGTSSEKDIGNEAGEIAENGSTLGSLKIVETDSQSKLISSDKNTAFNKSFGTGNDDVARGDASYPKSDVDSLLENKSTTDRNRVNHTGVQDISTITNLQTALDGKQDTSQKGIANGYASLNSSGEIPPDQIPALAKSSKVLDNISGRDNISNDDRFEGLMVCVLDATSDSTVSSSGAGYILKSGLSNSDWVKIYETESLDLNLTGYFDKTNDTLDDINQGTTNKHFDSNSESKLNGIEENATADQTAVEIKVAYESNADTNAFSDSDKLNLSNQSNTNSGDETILSIQSKRPLKTVEGQSIEGTGNIDLIKDDVGLENVDNTSDQGKPISTAQQAGLDEKLAVNSNLSDVNSRQTALSNLTDGGNSNAGQVLTNNNGVVEFADLPVGSVPNATSLTAGIGKIATQAEAEAGTDDTNKFLNPLKNKQAFDSSMSSLIFARRSSATVLSYNSDIVVEFPNSGEDLGEGLSYSSGIFTVNKPCRLFITFHISFRNNTNTLSDDSCKLGIEKSTDGGTTWVVQESLSINPSELVDAGNELVQGGSACVSFISSNQFKITIAGVSDTQEMVNRLINIKE
jgi:hypothetical protein